MFMIYPRDRGRLLSDWRVLEDSRCSIQDTLIGELTSLTRSVSSNVFLAFADLIHLVRDSQVLRKERSDSIL